MQSPKIIAANWKMYKTLPEVVSYFSQFNRVLETLPNKQSKEIIFFTPSMLLTTVKSVAHNSIGAQNIHHEEEGAFTGETSIKMIKDLCSWVLAGHSERRLHCHETDEQINKKVKLALQHQKKVMLCIGETTEEREQGKTEEVLKMRLFNTLKGVYTLKNVAITYEPYWAISNGNPLHQPATPEMVEKVHTNIYNTLLEKYSPDEAGNIAILYGGSVKKENVAAFTAKQHVNGVLVGRASLDPEEFLEIIMQC